MIAEVSIHTVYIPHTGIFKEESRKMLYLDLYAAPVDFFQSSSVIRAIHVHKSIYFAVFWNIRVVDESSFRCPVPPSKLSGFPCFLEAEREKQ